MAGVEHANDAGAGAEVVLGGRFGRGLQRQQLRFQAGFDEEVRLRGQGHGTETAPLPEDPDRGEVDMGGQVGQPDFGERVLLHAMPAVAEEAPGPMARAVQLGGGIAIVDRDHEAASQAAGRFVKPRGEAEAYLRGLALREFAGHDPDVGETARQVGR